jgi:hypothetical protein
MVRLYPDDRTMFHNNHDYYIFSRVELLSDGEDN